MKLLTACGASPDQGQFGSELKTMLDTAHRAMLTAFKVSERARYQIIHEKKPYQMIFEDTGRGLTHTRQSGDGTNI